MRRTAIAVFTIAMTSFVSGCANNLTREKAKDILDEVAKKAPNKQITLSFEQLQNLVGLPPEIKQGFGLDPAAGGGTPCVPTPGPVTLLNGHFVPCVGYIPPTISLARPGIIATFIKPISWKVVDITGISDASDGSKDKIIDFTWQYDFSYASQKVQNAISPAPVPSRASMRLYDDGWRFVGYKPVS